jgi:hypothetical protein
MNTQEVNPQNFITVLMEQRNEALNKLASSVALNMTLEQKLKELQSADENKDT